MKSPAFRFYADDFVAGTVDMTSEEIGPYILLLCYQWSKGGVPSDPKIIRRICRVGDDFGLDWVKVKFKLVGGNYVNERLEIERRKQDDFRERQRINGEKGGRPKATVEAASSNPINNGERPSLKEVHFQAEKIGLAPWKAEDWFNEMEGCGWLDHNKRPVMKWQSLIQRVKIKWDADGRPMGPPVSKFTGQSDVKPRKPTKEEMVAAARG